MKDLIRKIIVELKENNIANRLILSENFTFNAEELSIEFDPDFDLITKNNLEDFEKFKKKEENYDRFVKSNKIILNENG
mgnify:CR=1 FL=1